jgi:hypothetical protein
MIVRNCMTEAPGFGVQRNLPPTEKKGKGKKHSAVKDDAQDSWATSRSTLPGSRGFSCFFPWIVLEAHLASCVSSNSIRHIMRAMSERKRWDGAEATSTISLEHRTTMTRNKQRVRHSRSLTHPHTHAHSASSNFNVLISSTGKKDARQRHVTGG